jgi:Xaa-Pro aminopeptidase
LSDIRAAPLSHCWSFLSEVKCVKHLTSNSSSAPGLIGFARFRERGLDAIFVMQPTNVCYVSGFWKFVPTRIEAVLVPAIGECVFIVSKNEYEYAVKTSRIEGIRYYTELPENSRHLSESGEPCVLSVWQPTICSICN